MAVYYFFLIFFFFLSSNCNAIENAEKTPPIPKSKVQINIEKELNPIKKPLDKPNIENGSQKDSAQSYSLIQLKTALDIFYKGDIKGALAIRDRFPKDDLNQQIINWLIATSTNKKIPFSFFNDIILQLKDWPAQDKIRYNAHMALLRETKDPATIIKIFNRLPSSDYTSIYALLSAYLKLNDTNNAQKVLHNWWPTAELTKTQEENILRIAAPLLSFKDNFQRMQKLLINNQKQAAYPLAKFTQTLDLYNAVTAALSHKKDSLKKLEKIENKWHDSEIYQFAKVHYLRYTKQYDQAFALIMQREEKQGSSVNPDKWWNEKRVLSREMLNNNAPQKAYDLVQNSIGYTHKSAAEAQFHAGWYALRFLNKPDVALKHFSQIIHLSKRSISLARGYYWMGRAYESMKNFEEAKSCYQKAASYNTTYYGQLANIHLKKELLPPQHVSLSTEDFIALFQHPPAQAILTLERIDYQKTAKKLALQIADASDNPKEIAILIDWLQKKGDFFSSIKLAKNVLNKGIDIGFLAFPLEALKLPDSATPKEAAFAYAIARQESEFNPKAHSSAGARGMLQILPSTAKKIAKKNKIPYSYNKLLDDPAYSSALGFYYLKEKHNIFSGSYILTCIAYNAGTRRAYEWIKRYNDPRTLSLYDVIDWIERIPYPETHNYVMRVLENYQIYKMRFKLKSNIEADLMAKTNL